MLRAVFDCAISTKEGTVIHVLKRYSAFAELHARLRASLPVCRSSSTTQLQILIFPDIFRPTGNSNLSSTSYPHYHRSLRCQNSAPAFWKDADDSCNIGYRAFCYIPISEGAK